MRSHPHSSRPCSQRSGLKRGLTRSQPDSSRRGGNPRSPPTGISGAGPVWARGTGALLLFLPPPPRGWSVLGPAARSAGAPARGDPPLCPSSRGAGVGPPPAGHSASPRAAAQETLKWAATTPAPPGRRARQRRAPAAPGSRATSGQGRRGGGGGGRGTPRPQHPAASTPEPAPPPPGRPNGSLRDARWGQQVRLRARARDSATSCKCGREPAGPRLLPVRSRAHPMGGCERFLYQHFLERFAEPLVCKGETSKFSALPGSLPGQPTRTRHCTPHFSVPDKEKLPYFRACKLFGESKQVH